MEFVIVLIVTYFPGGKIGCSVSTTQIGPFISKNLADEALQKILSQTSLNSSIAKQGTVVQTRR